MQMFDLLFPLFMIAFPAVTTLFARTKETAGLPEAVRLEKRLWSITGIGLVLVVLIWTARILTDRGVLPDVLPTFAWKLIPGAILAQGGFFLLWFRFAMPLIRLYRPEIDTATATLSVPTHQPERSASLTPRRPPSALDNKSAVWTLGLWLLGFLLFLYGWKTHGTPEGKTTSQHLTLCGVGLAAALSIALVIPLGHRTLFLRPEPLIPGQSQELLEAHRQMRGMKARWMFASILFLIGLLLAVPIALAFHVAFTGAMAGVIGAVVGSTIGLAGGAFGTMVSLYRLKIQRIEQAD
jgi:hypothetical protein